MTRILITTIPIEGHVRPALPVARHLAADGHDVTWYTGQKFRELVTGTGARFAPVTRGLDYDESDIDVLHDMEDKKPGLAGLKKIVNELFIAPIPKYAADVAPLIDELMPDVVVADHCFMAGPLIAAQRGIPKILFSIGPLSLSSIDTAPFGMGLPPSSSALGRRRNQILSWTVRNAIFRQTQRMAGTVLMQMSFPPPAGFFMDWGVQIADRYLLAGIPEFEYPRSDQHASVEFVGPMLPQGPPEGWTAPAWWPDLAEARSQDRPVVVITQGTANIDPALLILPAIAALADEDVLVVATTGGPPPDALLRVAERPANLRLESFVPFTELLPHASAMVTNGGYGGVQMSLAWGVPLVVAGMGEDKMEVNARVAWSGAGLSLRTHRARPDRIRTAVRAVLTEDSYRARADELQQAYARYSGAAQAAGIVIKTAGHRRLNEAQNADL